MIALDLKKPHQRYRNAKRDILSGVTTVLGTLNKDAIPPWYAQMEREGILDFMGDRAWTADVLSQLLPTKEDGKPLWYGEQKRDRAADLGTITHGRIEAWLRNTTLDPAGLPADLYAKSDIGLARFVAWWNGQGLTIVATELQMVSERLQVGGTGDIFARRPTGKLVYADIKTSKASKYWPYDETIAQSVTYAEMYEEIHGEEVDEVVVVRVGKEPGDELQPYLLNANEWVGGSMLFEAALAAYNAKKMLKRKR